MVFGKQVNKYYLKYWYFFLGGLLALVAVDYFQLLIPEVYGSIIDGLNNKVPFDKQILLGYIKEMFLIMAVMVFGRFLWRICIFGVGIRIEADLRDKMYNHAKDLSQEYYSEHKTGALMALYTNDLQTIKTCFGQGTVMLIDAIFLGLLSFIKMARINTTLTLLSLIPLGIFAVCASVVGKYMDKKWTIRQEAYEKMSDFTQETFSGISVVKAFVKELKELSNFSKINHYNEEKNVDFVKASTLLNVLIGVILNTVLIIILGYGSNLIYQNPDVFTVGKLNEYIGYFTTSTWPMMALAQLINMTSQGQASLKRISNLLNEKNTIVEPENPVIIDNPKGKIEFRSLNFKYPGTEKEVLRDINILIEPGQSIGILGHTGSGKTTLVDLLLRIYNVDRNTILIDDVDIMDLKIKQVRDIVSYVPQDNFLFSEKIRNNISFAYKDADINEVIEYAKLADVDDNIQDFPLKYDTILGERGVTVSGGQKQRISIARALMKNSEVLVLDDSVSAVDTKTEEIILENLRKIRKDKTTIIIAHRISTVKDLDKILMLDNGKVIAFGSHDELLSSSKEYAKLVEMQNLEAEVGGSLNE